MEAQKAAFISLSAKYQGMVRRCAMRGAVFLHRPPAVPSGQGCSARFRIRIGNPAKQVKIFAGIDDADLFTRRLCRKSGAREIDLLADRPGCDPVAITAINAGIGCPEACVASNQLGKFLTLNTFHLADVTPIRS